MLVPSSCLVVSDLWGVGRSISAALALVDGPTIILLATSIVCSSEVSELGAELLEQLGDFWITAGVWAVGPVSGVIHLYAVPVPLTHNDPEP
ncbi:hypothetical protein ACLKA7_001365 [Drosophila subpalustris]